MYASEDGEFPHIPINLAGGHHLMDYIKHLLDLTLGLAFDAFGEEGGGGFGDAATGTQKTAVLNPFSVHDDEELQLITAERIMSLGRKSRLGQFVKIARPFAVVENNLLVKIA